MSGQEPNTLLEISTRYRHWTELIDIFGDGVVVLERTQERYSSPADAKRIMALNIAIELIQDQIDSRSGFSQGALWEVRDLVDRIPEDPSQIRDDE